MIQREPKEVVQLIASGRWKKKHVLSFQTQFGDRALLDVLLCPFIEDCSTNQLTAFVCQQSAGELLLDMMPSCDVPLRQTIRCSLPLWNLSVEEWPFYLCRCFGIETVSETISDIANTSELCDEERRATDTLLYWLRAKPDKILGTAIH